MATRKSERLTWRRTARPGPPLHLREYELSRLLERFADEFLDGKSPETVGTYRRSLSEFERWFAREPDTFEFTQQDVERYKTFLTEERGLHPVSVSTYLTAVRRFCDFLVEEKLLDKNPAGGVKGNRRPAGHSRPVMTAPEVARLLAAVDSTGVLGKRDLAMMFMMVYSGLSEIEIVRADLRDLEQTLMGWYLRVQGKGRTVKDQHVPVDPLVMTRIRIYLDARGRIKPENPLFVSHGHRSDGQRLNTRTVRSRINGYLKNAGLKTAGFSPHSLTHTAAVLWLKDGMPIEEVRARMRHGTEETTRIYLKRLGIER